MCQHSRLQQLVSDFDFEAMRVQRRLLAHDNKFQAHDNTSKPCSLKLSMVHRHQAWLCDCLLDISPIRYDCRVMCTSITMSKPLKSLKALSAESAEHAEHCATSSWSGGSSESKQTRLHLSCMGTSALQQQIVRLSVICKPCFAHAASLSTVHCGVLPTL